VGEGGDRAAQLDHELPGITGQALVGPLSRNGALHFGTEVGEQLRPGGIDGGGQITDELVDLIAGILDVLGDPPLATRGRSPGLESLANLHELPAMGAWIIALPMKIAGGSGGPLRAIALVPTAGKQRGTGNPWGVSDPRPEFHFRVDVHLSDQSIVPQRELTGGPVYPHVGFQQLDCRNRGPAFRGAGDARSGGVIHGCDSAGSSSAAGTAGLRLELDLV
jgi:hypothetical protein